MNGPNPGSTEALALGCTCAVMDNGHGNGWCSKAGVFIVSLDCPVHGKKGWNSPGDLELIDYTDRLKSLYRRGDLAYEMIDARDGYRKAEAAVSALRSEAHGNPAKQAAFDRFRSAACTNQAMPE